jgi:hypothetical protein
MAQPPLQQTTAIQATPIGDRWWKIEIESTDAVDDIQAKFTTLFESAGSPGGAAIFCDHVLLHYTSLLFTPQAITLAKTLLADYGGVECEEPKQGIFLAGDEEHRDRLSAPDLEKAPPQQQQ